MRLKTRPYDPDRPDTRTPAQKAATERNFKIFRLRALATQAWLLTGQRRDRLRKLVDQELKAMGADTEEEHREKVMGSFGLPGDGEKEPPFDEVELSF